MGRKKSRKTYEVKQEKDIQKKEEFLQKIIEELKCSTGCVSEFALSDDDRRERDTIAELHRNLPMVSFLADEMVNYIFSNGLTTGNDEGDKVLKGFLYTKTPEAIFNYDVIKSAVKIAIIYGNSGIRNVDDECLSLIKNDYYEVLKTFNKSTAIEETQGYLVKYDLDDNGGTFNYNNETTYNVKINNKIILDEETQNYFISTDNFLNLRNTITKDYGESPLNMDRLRIDFIRNVYNRVNYEVTYDGVGTIIIEVDDDAVGDSIDLQIQLRSGELTEQSFDEVKKRGDRFKDVVSEITKSIKNSGNNAVIALSKEFKKVTQLNKTTSSKDYLEYMDGFKAQMAEIMGMPSSLIGIGSISGNVSMERIIDNAIQNDIVPLREKYATQLSSLIAPILKKMEGGDVISKIYFRKEEPTYYTTEMKEADVQVRIIAEFLKYDETREKGFELIEKIEKKFGLDVL